MSKNWVSKLIDLKKPFPIENKLLASIFNVNLFMNIFVITFLILRRNYMSGGFFMAYVSALLWMNLGPFLIWYADNKVFPEFFKNSRGLVSDDAKLDFLEQKYGKMISKVSWVSIILVTVALVSVFLLSHKFLSIGGIFGFGDIIYWIFFIGVIWLGLLVSNGFLGVVVTMFAVRDIANEELHLDPLHPDNVGGLSCVGNYAIATTLLFSSGALFLPLAFQVARGAPAMLPIILVAVVIFSLFILLSFVYPTYIINQKAKKIRDGVLEDLRGEYLRLQSKVKTYDLHNISDKEHLKALAIYSKLDHIRSEFVAYNTLKLYPFEFSILAKLGGSVLLPLVFWAMDYFVIG